ncbi:MAG TPA: DUF1684 domain-containing protein [Candidatus Polarisedimenticolia bacterium]|nr:DUF1684 domain-containing protein [Candidatus Polarisedimenticolia bacterium]
MRLPSGLRSAAGPLAAAGLLLGMSQAGGDYARSIETWRHEREARLKSDDGWLTVAGLFWLKEGPNRFGSAASNDIVLPAGSAPPAAGVFEFHDGRARLKALEGVTITSSGRPVTTMDLRSDDPGPPDLLVLGDLTMFVIKRGDRFAIRLRDRNNAARREFAGLHWFPIREEYRVVASFQRYDPPRRIAIPNILGQTEQLPCPGSVSFTLGGRTLTLEPVIEEPGATELFYIFRDRTSGQETYGAGRFLYSDMPKDGTVVLDFNKAYTPPCAFTPYATCPLPPKQNILDLRIEAGELNYGHH